MLTCRKNGIEQVNKVFGTNISVELNSVWEDVLEERELALEVMKSEIETSENDSGQLEDDDNSVQAENIERSDEDVSNERPDDTNS